MSGPTHILGLNTTHDASAALLRDGEIVCAVEEERLSRRKHHYGFPHRAVETCLAAAGIGLADLDHAGFYWDLHRGRLAFLGHVLRHFPRSLAYFDHQPGIYREFRALPGRLRELGFRGRFHYLGHHENHVASAFWPSGFPEAAALTVDGTGEWWTTVLGRLGRDGALHVLEKSTYPHSIGKLWEAVTQHLGFRPDSGQGKVMGLAPYGRPALVAEFRKLIRVRPDGRLRLNLRYFDFHFGRSRYCSRRFHRDFGLPREPEGRISERHEDVAFALQAVTEEILLELARRLHAATGLPRLVMAGGVALNSVANGRILRESSFTEVFVQPSAGDSGAALGAALRVWHEVLGRGTEGRCVPGHSFLGPEFGPEECRAAARERGLEPRSVADPAREAAAQLAAGRIVGWFTGRMEYGPRALGHRSILADPRPAGVKDRLNSRVKHRESFRPFAPAVTIEDAEAWFETGGVEVPYMLKVFPVRAAVQDQISGVTHVDGTARVQTVSADTNPLFHRLIRCFGELTGVPVVLNTSLNVRGEPIVCTPADAVACFAGTDLDTLFLGNLLVEKPPKTRGGGARAT